MHGQHLFALHEHTTSLSVVHTAIPSGHKGHQHHTKSVVLKAMCTAKPFCRTLFFALQPPSPPSGGLWHEKRMTKIISSLFVTDRHLCVCWGLLLLSCKTKLHCRAGSRQKAFHKLLQAPQYSYFWYTLGSLTAYSATTKATVLVVGPQELWLGSKQVKVTLASE